MGHETVSEQPAKIAKPFSELAGFARLLTRRGVNSVTIRQLMADILLVEGNGTAPKSERPRRSVPVRRGQRAGK